MVHNMSYIQVEIGGKLRGLKFNQYAHIIIQEKLDPEFPTASINTALFYGGLKGNCFVKGEELTKTVVALGPPDEAGNEKEVPATFEDVCDWVDNLSEDDILAVYNVYMNTTAFLKAKELQAKSEDKKKEEVLTEEVTDQNVISSPAEN